MRDDLLTPSLSNTARTVGLYSLRSSLLLGFFGGPLPLVLYWALNSWRLKRPFDAIVYVLAILGFAAFAHIYYSAAAPEFVRWLGLRVGMQIYAMALWTGFYVMHRKQFRSMTLFGVASPSPWIALVACFAAGLGLTVAIVEIVKPGGWV